MHQVVSLSFFGGCWILVTLTNPWFFVKNPCWVFGPQNHRASPKASPQGWKGNPPKICKLLEVMLHQTLLLIGTSISRAFLWLQSEFSGPFGIGWVLDVRSRSTFRSSPGFEALKRTWVQPSISITEVGKGDLVNLGVTWGCR